MISGKNVFLRALEPTDLDFLYQVENDTSLWGVSGTQIPFSKYLLEQYLQQAHLDIYEAKQLRLVICDLNSALPLGLIDLFDFDPQHQRAGVGIVISNNSQRLQGIGSEALELLLSYAFKTLNLNQIYANIETENKVSIQLFSKFGFEMIGIKKQWNKKDTHYADEALFQLINRENER